MKRVCSFVVLALLCCGVSASFGAEQVDNPMYKNWTKFKPGAFVKLKSVSKYSGQENVSEITYKLVEVTPEKAVIEMEMKMTGMGEMPPSKSNMDVPAKVDNTMLPENNPDVKIIEQNEGKVDVKGKSVSAKHVKSESNANGMKTVSETWESEEIPGGMAKVTSNTKMGETDITTEMSVVDYSGM